jgi:hypothetical protein
MPRPMSREWRVPRCGDFATPLSHWLAGRGAPARVPPRRARRAPCVETAHRRVRRRGCGPAHACRVGTRRRQSDAALARPPATSRAKPLLPSLPYLRRKSTSAELAIESASRVRVLQFVKRPSGYYRGDMTTRAGAGRRVADSPSPRSSQAIWPMQPMAAPRQSSPDRPVVTSAIATCAIASSR